MKSSIFCLLFISVFMHCAFAADTDADGLHEIDTIAELNDIRNSLNGASLLSSTSGCPIPGSPVTVDGVVLTSCIGFELTVNLDFDADGNGDLSNDAFWNGGSGWVPVGSEPASFNAVFEG